MKRFVVVVSFLGVSILTFLVVERSPSSESIPAHRGSAYPSEAMEGTADNPLARVEYDWMRLKDPATNEIPRGIAHKELDFVHRMEQEADLHAVTRSDDWVSRGPNNIGGRTKALAIDVTNENVIMAGSITSGMFKSIDGGNSWVRTTTPDQLPSVTWIAQNKSPGRENIWYYGTGDRSPVGLTSSANGFHAAFYRGDGIFKSVDGGDTWARLPSTISNSAAQTNIFDFISGLATFGDDGVLAATAAGVYKSTDGGATWNESLGIGGLEAYQFEQYPSVEIAVASGGTFYAAVGGSGPYAGVYRSTDEGANWGKISPDDWPASTHRTVIAPAPSNDQLVYFFTETEEYHQQLRKYEPGVGWSDLSSGLPFDAQMATYGGYMMTLYVKPDDENTLFLGAFDLFRSTDGGASFELISGHGPRFHVDQNSLAFYPSNPNRMIAGNDGGLYRVENNLAATTDENLDWNSLNNGYLTTQFYTVAVDHGMPGSEVVIGGTQDNGVEFTDSSDPDAPWTILRGGDGGNVVIADGGQYVYFGLAATLQLWRATPPYDFSKQTQITPTSGLLGFSATPMVLDPHDQKIMYAAMRRTVWRNSDLTAIPDGGEQTDVNWDTLQYLSDDYVMAMGMSPAEPRRLYLASLLPDYSVRVLYIDNPQEGQKEPVDITGGLPTYAYGAWVSCIAVDPRDANKVMLVLSNHGVISIYASEDGGSNWTPVAGNLEEHPDGSGNGPTVRWLSILYVQDQPVYLAATSVGIFSSIKLDGMNTIWSPEARTSIGNRIVDMIDVRQSDGFVAAATHGNGVYTTYITTLPAVATAIEEPLEQPEAFEIASAYPNPFATSTTIAYDLPRAGAVSAGVFDIRGRKVATLFDGVQRAGRQELRWNASSAADGVYFVRVDYANQSRTERVVLQR